MSFVEMERGICPICGVIHDFGGGVLIHKKLRDIPTEKTVTGYRLCEEHSNLKDQGYIALIAVSNENVDNVKISEANRTGDIAHIKLQLFADMFKPTVFNLDETPFVFCDQAVINFVKEIHSQLEESDHG